MIVDASAGLRYVYGTAVSRHLCDFSGTPTFLILEKLKKKGDSSTPPNQKTKKSIFLNNFTTIIFNILRKLTSLKNINWIQTPDF